MASFELLVTSSAFILPTAKLLNFHSRHLTLETKHAKVTKRHFDPEHV